MQTTSSQALAIPSSVRKSSIRPFVSHSSVIASRRVIMYLLHLLAKKLFLGLNEVRLPIIIIYVPVITGITIDICVCMV